jgi:uncharacterized protein YdeI (YjbR/CyaY-like superfamily)
MTTSPVSKRIDAAFDKHSGDIKKLLDGVRSAVHASKSGLSETWKWGPGFEKDGKLILGLWGFKKHVSFVLYRGAELKDKHKLINDGFDNAHNRMVKFTEYKQFNKKKLIDLVKEAVKLHDSGAEKVNKSQMKVPAELTKFFATNKSAGKFFNELPHTFQREMVQYITKVKTKPTREKHVKEVCAALKGKKRSVA